MTCSDFWMTVWLNASLWWYFPNTSADTEVLALDANFTFLDTSNWGFDISLTESSHSDPDPLYEPLYPDIIVLISTYAAALIGVFPLFFLLWRSFGFLFGVSLQLSYFVLKTAVILSQILQFISFLRSQWPWSLLQRSLRGLTWRDPLILQKLKHVWNRIVWFAF